MRVQPFFNNFLLVLFQVCLLFPRPLLTFIFGSSLTWSLPFSGFFIFSAPLRFRRSSSRHLRRSSSRRRLRSSSRRLLSSFFSSLILWGEKEVYLLLLSLAQCCAWLTCLFFRKSSRGVVFLALEKIKVRFSGTKTKRVLINLMWDWATWPYFVLLNKIVIEVIPFTNDNDMIQKQFLFTFFPFWDVLPFF